MKKIITKIMAVILLTVCALSLVACGVGPKPNLDLEDIYNNMIKNDNEIVIYDNGNQSSIEKRLTVQGIVGNNLLSIAKYKSSYMARLAYKQHKLAYEGTVREYEVMIEILEFKLSEYEDEMTEAEYASVQKNLEKLIAEYENYKANYCYGRSGKYVWYGQKDMIERTI